MTKNQVSSLAFQGSEKNLDSVFQASLFHGGTDNC